MQNEEERKPTLTNDRKRREYVEDDANWERVSMTFLNEDAEGSIKAERLKGTNIVRLMGRLAANGYFPAHWTLLKAYEFNPDGSMKDVYDLSEARMAARLRELRL